MPILRMKAPAGVTAFSHEGHPAELDDDGVVLIDHRHAADYTAHGFTAADAPRRSPPAPVPEPRPFAPPVEARPQVAMLLDKLMHADDSTLARLVAALEEPAPIALSTDPALIRAADPRPVDSQAAADAIPTEGPLTAEQIERMTVPQMKAWLRKRAVPMEGVGSDADVLRAKVIHANVE